MSTSSGGWGAGSGPGSSGFDQNWPDQGGFGAPGGGGGFGSPGGGGGFGPPGGGGGFGAPGGGFGATQGGFAGAPGDPFGSSGTMDAPAPLERVAAPVGWLYAALGLALVSGIVASLLGGLPVVAIVCWALAGPVVIGLLAVYLMKDVAGRAHLTYSPPVWGPTLYAVCLVLTFIAVIIASLQIAFWVGRL